MIRVAAAAGIVLASCGTQVPADSVECEAPKLDAGGGPACEVEYDPLSQPRPPGLRAECAPFWDAEGLELVPVRIHNRSDGPLFVDTIKFGHTPYDPRFSLQLSVPPIGTGFPAPGWRCAEVESSCAWDDMAAETLLRLEPCATLTQQWPKGVYVPDTLPTGCAGQYCAAEDIPCWRLESAPLGLYELSVSVSDASLCIGRDGTRGCPCLDPAAEWCAGTDIDWVDFVYEGDRPPRHWTVTTVVSVTDTSACDGIDIVIE